MYRRIFKVFGFLLAVISALSCEHQDISVSENSLNFDKKVLPINVIVRKNVAALNTQHIGEKQDIAKEENEEGDLEHLIVQCGNGRVEGDEECDSPNNIHCTDDCKLPLCGNHVLDAHESCDPPDDEDCNSNCQWLQ